VRLRVEPMLLAALLAGGHTAFADQAPSTLPAAQQPAAAPADGGDAEGEAGARTAPAEAGLRASALSRAEVAAAADRLRADPNLGGTETVKALRWSRAGAPRPDAPTPAWVRGLFDFLSQFSSVLLWVAGAVAAAIAIVWSARVLTARAPAGSIPAPPVVSRLRDIDLRPESLPDDVGAAALALFEAGRSREALSLMYRAALSRAVHRHHVRIGESFTEGEVLRAVNSTLDPPRAAYISEIIAVWQRVVYAGEAVLHERFARLCRTFAPTLDGALV
jgi:hypothetical protein